LRRQLRREVGVDGVPELAAEERSGVTGFDDLTEALETLNAEHRAVVVLRYVLEFSPGEIARLLDIPRGTVNSRMRRGLDALRDALEGAGS
jgi:RNA polymerase sigma-70 factor (ECF subfamily)